MMSIMKTTLITAGMAGLLFASCEPARRIVMKNESGAPASVTWNIKEDSIHSSPFFISNSREMRFDLTPGRPGNRIPISCGIGSWTIRELNQVLDDLDSLEISSHSEEKCLRTEKEMREYLLPKRKGLDKGRIEIVLK